MWAALAITVTALVTPAAASSEQVCAGPRPAPGQAVRGPVLHIPSADLMCVATGRDRSQWVPVPLAVSAASRSRLMSTAFGENALCMINKDGRGICHIEGDALSARLHRTSTQPEPQWR